MNFCLLLLAASCSMEDDMLSDFDNGMVETGKEVYAGLNFNLTTGAGIHTKSSTAAGTTPLTTDEATITTCYVVVADGNKIIGNHFYPINEITPLEPYGSLQAGYSLTTHIAVKVPASTQVLKAFIVAYATRQDEIDFSKFSLLSDLKEAVISNPFNDFVKTGEVEIVGFETSDKMSYFQDGKNCKGVEVNLTLRAAAVELESIKAQYKVNETETKPLNIAVTSMTMNNQAITTQLLANSKVHFSEGATGMDSKGRNYCYSNTGGDKTTVTINYVVDGTTPGTFTFPLKTADQAEVLAGHLYKLNVTITNSVATVKVTTLDWKYNKVIESMEEVVGE